MRREAEESESEREREDRRNDDRMIE